MEKTKIMAFMSAEVYDEEYAKEKKLIAGITKQLESLDNYFRKVKTYDCKGEDLETKVVSEDKCTRLRVFNDKLGDFITEMNMMILNINRHK